MSPALDRNVIVDEEYFISISSADLTLTSDHEGWLLYNSTSQRYKFWDGSAWKTLAHSPVTGSDLGDGSVTDAKLRDSAALSVIGRSANSTGDPADIATTASSNAVLRESGGVLGFGQVSTSGLADGAVTTLKLNNASVTEAKLGVTTGPGMLTVKTTGAPEYKVPSAYPATVLFKDASTDPQLTKISGTSFPSSPVDGQRFYHTTHKFSYIYDSSASGWLSESVFEIQYGNSVDLVSSAYAELDEQAGFATYSATIGHLFGFAVKVIGISLCQAATPGGNVTVEVWDDGAAVASSSAQLVTALQSDAIETLMSTTIASKSIISVRIAGGTAEGPFRGIVRFRRFET